MNNRFKFRVAIRQEDGSYRVCEVATIAWRSDKTIVEYNYVADAKHGKIGTIVIDGENAILEQCTGLTDKNGKLIYEGDVLQAPGQTIAYKVQWAHHGFVAKVGFSSAKSYPVSNCEMFEIIGNIHEMDQSK